MEKTTSQPKLSIKLRILGETIDVQTPMPPERVRLDETLPFLRAIDDRAISLSVVRAEATGAKVSCCKGCSACCRAQPVPVTPPEAYALARLVDRMPKPRQDEVRRRFADCVERLKAAGLADIFLDRPADLDEQGARAFAERYFGLGLVCPFLENDACGIYEERPFVCRQYLVTSPASMCLDPFHEPVKTVPMAITPATATQQVAEQLLGRPQLTVPLTLALEYARAHRAELERKFPARELFPRLVNEIAAKG